MSSTPTTLPPAAPSPLSPHTPDLQLSSSSASSSRTAASSFVGTPHSPPSGPPPPPAIASPSSRPGTPRSRRSSSLFALAGLSLGNGKGKSSSADGSPSGSYPQQQRDERQQLASPEPFVLPGLPSPSPFLRSAVPSRPTTPYPSSPSPSLLTLTRPTTPLPPAPTAADQPAAHPPAPPPSSAAAAARLPKPASTFTSALPREVKLLVFRALLDQWAADEQAGVRRGDRWVGEGAGRRELLKLSRVSKEWRSLVLDGWLWPTLSTSPFPFAPPPSPRPLSTTTNGADDTLSPANIRLLAAHATTFVRTLELRDVDLSSAELRRVGLELAGEEEDGDEREGGQRGTALRVLDLRACRGVGEGALGQLVAKSGDLTTINLAHHPAVTRSLVALLAASCPYLSSITLSRCPALEGTGVLPLLRRRPPAAPPLETLRLAGIKRITAVVVHAIGRASGKLKTLDLSATDLTDGALAALVELGPDEADAGAVVRVVSRGRAHEPSPPGVPYDQRSFPSLQHVNLSSCPGLTDDGLSVLAGSLPAARSLQLAALHRLPAHLLPREPESPPPLARLLSSFPLLAKVDLEEADAADDDCLRALAREGNTLEHVVVSGCRRVGGQAVAGLVEGCKALRVLEADGTRLADQGVRAFVEGARARGARHAAISVLDSQVVSRSSTVPLLPLTRTRAGQPGYAYAPFAYQFTPSSPAAAAGDAPPPPLPAGRDELDGRRPTLACFWAWGVVDAVRKEVARERREAAAREAELAAAAAAAFATPSNDGGGGTEGEGGGSRGERLATVVGGRRLLGWRSASGASVVLLDPAASAARPAIGRRAVSGPATPVAGTVAVGGGERGGRGDDGRGCVVM